MDFFETLLAAVAPHRCIDCNTEGSLLCIVCRSQIVTKQPRCYSCHRRNINGQTCSDCRAGSSLDGVTVAARYDSAAGHLVRGLKYHGQIAATKALSDLLAPLLTAADFDVVTAIPGAPSHYRHRGYHQAELIAKKVARQLGLPYRSMLGRLEGTSQVGSTRDQRLAQVKNRFWAKAAAKEQRVLLIDDVLTTGATLSEAASELKQSGAKSVWGAVVARD